MYVLRNVADGSFFYGYDVGDIDDATGKRNVPLWFVSDINHTVKFPTQKVAEIVSDFLEECGFSIQIIEVVDR